MSRTYGTYNPHTLSFTTHTHTETRVQWDIKNLFYSNVTFDRSHFSLFSHTYTRIHTYTLNVLSHLAHLRKRELWSVERAMHCHADGYALHSTIAFALATLHHLHHLPPSMSTDCWHLLFASLRDLRHCPVQGHLARKLMKARGKVSLVKWTTSEEK